MNRNETKLLVENWRKVLNEGLYDSDPELLEEINFKKGLATAGLIASIFGSILGGASTADAKLAGLTLAQNTAVKQVIQKAFKDQLLNRNQMEELFKLMNKAQSDKEVKLTPSEKSKVKFLLKMHKKIVNKLQDNLKDAKNDFRKAYTKYNEYIKFNPDATYASFDEVERKLSGNLEFALDQLKEAREDIKEFTKLYLKFKIDTEKLPNGFEETKVILDNNGNIAEVDGEKLYYVTKKFTVR